MNSFLCWFKNITFLTFCLPLSLSAQLTEADSLQSADANNTENTNPVTWNVWVSNHSLQVEKSSKGVYTCTHVRNHALGEQDTSLSGLIEFRQYVSTLLPDHQIFRWKEYNSSGNVVQTRALDEHGLSLPLPENYSDDDIRASLEISKTKESRIALKDYFDSLDSSTSIQITGVASAIKVVSESEFEEKIGVFTMKRKVIDVLEVSNHENFNCWTFSPDPNPTESKITVKQVLVSISSGFITDVEVLTEDDKLFTLRYRDVFHLYFWDDKNRLLYINTEGENPELCLRLKDVLSYRRYANNAYNPDDVFFELSKEGETRELNHKYTLNSLIDFNFYSDATSLLGETGNGLINFELDVYVPLNTAPWPLGSVTLLSDISGDFKYTRFDQGEFRLSRDDNGQTSIAPLEVFQRAKYGSGLNLGVFQSIPRTGRFELGLDAQGGYLRTELFDSLGIAEDLTTWFVGGRLHTTMRRNKRLQFNLQARMRYYQSASGPDFDSLAGVAPGTLPTVWLWGVELEIVYQLRNESNDAFFFRYGFWDQTNYSEGDFTYLQFGYRLNLYDFDVRRNIGG